MTDNALLIFVKNFIPGHVKTRLAATIGNEAAMNIYLQLLHHTNMVANNIEADRIVFYSDFIEDDIWQNGVYKKEIQEGNSLGMKMENAFKSSFTAGYQKIIIIGTDCPSITVNILRTAFLKLENHEVVIGPATDGGYYLLGLKKVYPYLFQNMKWSTDEVLQQTIDLCKIHQLSYFLLPEFSDIDEEKDLIHFEKLLMLKKSS